MRTPGWKVKKNVNVCKNASLVIPWYNVHGLGMKSTIQNPGL